MKFHFKIIPWLLNALIWYLCLGPNPEVIPRPFSRTDLLYHSSAYLTLTLGFSFFYPQKKSLIGFLLTVQGILIEIIQPYFQRHFDHWDILANVSGIILAFFIGLTPLGAFLLRLKSRLVQQAQSQKNRD